MDCACRNASPKPGNVCLLITERIAEEYMRHRAMVKLRMETKSLFYCNVGMFAYVAIPLGNLIFQYLETIRSPFQKYFSFDIWCVTHTKSTGI